MQTWQVLVQEVTGTKSGGHYYHYQVLLILPLNYRLLHGILVKGKWNDSDFTITSTRRPRPQDAIVKRSQGKWQTTNADEFFRSV
eukprot:9740533-Ditylum_brightwellii.AAC.1